MIAAGLRHAALSRALISILLLACAGCYKYVPVSFDAPQQGQLIRAELSSDGERQVVPQLGPGVREVRGMTLENAATELSVLVEVVYGRQGVTPLDPQPIRLSPAHVAGMYERRLSRGRSALLGVGIIAAGVLLVKSFADLGRIFETGEDDEPGPQDFRVPIRIPIGR
ncbi:MAG TPA: hypothetical protein VMN60_11890 [Longimicrobiales bacterium]|nr:hypothetical protein [Longimicrobiales bacterium]